LSAKENRPRWFENYRFKRHLCWPAARLPVTEIFNEKLEKWNVDIRTSVVFAKRLQLVVL